MSEDTTKNVDNMSGLVEGIAPLGRMLGIDPNTLRKYVDKGMPVHKRGSGRGDPWLFITKDVHKWVVAMEVERAIEAAGGGDAEENAELAEWELRKKRADALIAEHRLAEERGMMIRMDDAVREREDADAQVRAALNDLPGRYCEDLALADAPEKALAVLRKAVEEVMNRLVLEFQDTPEIEGDEPGVDVAAMEVTQ